MIVSDGVGGVDQDASRTVFARSTSEVSGNQAAHGGGIASFGTVTLKDAASVTGNTATVTGGGIYIVGAPLNACTIWTAAISPNSPDDAPTSTLIAC